MTTPAVEDALREAAFEVMRQAYAPYSRFRVGAALAGPDARVFAACNVENAAYGSSICAERGAVVAAIAHGARDFDRLVIATEAEHPTPPCGACRQVLAEFNARLRITSCTTRGAEASWVLADLLPQPFLPQSLDRP